MLPEPHSLCYFVTAAAVDLIQLKMGFTFFQRPCTKRTWGREQSLRQFPPPGPLQKTLVEKVFKEGWQVRGHAP